MVGKGSGKTKCSKCGRLIRCDYNSDDGFICKKCWLETKTVIGLGAPAPCRWIDLENAQNTVRNVSSYVDPNKVTIRVSVSLPRCYAGKKVKVIVVDDEK